MRLMEREAEEETWRDSGATQPREWVRKRSRKRREGGVGWRGNVSGRRGSKRGERKREEEEG